MDGEISIEEVRTLLDPRPQADDADERETDSEEDEDVRIVDIRDPMAFERGHIPGSENVPFHELPSQIERFDGADHVVTVCPHGKASIQAARLIGSYEGSADARVESMAGGLEAWADQYELVTDEARPTNADDEEATTSDSRTPF